MMLKWVRRGRHFGHSEQKSPDALFALPLSEGYYPRSTLEHQGDMLLLLVWLEVLHGNWSGKMCFASELPRKFADFAESPDSSPFDSRQENAKGRADIRVQHRVFERKWQRLWSQTATQIPSPARLKLPQ